jgi:hypothetical protein
LLFLPNPRTYRLQLDVVEYQETERRAITVTVAQLLEQLLGSFHISSAPEQTSH